MTELQAGKYPMVALSRVAEIQLGKMLQPAPSSPFDQETAYLRAGSLSGLGNTDELPRMWCSPSDKHKYSVRLGDLLVAEGGDVGRTEFAPELSEPTVIQNSLHRVRSNSNDIRFLRYSLENIYNSGWLDVVCNKSTFGHLTVDKLASLQIPRPTVAVQRATADYLDAETARIDALIAKKQRMISLLNEQEERELFEAVGDWRSFESTSLRQYGTAVFTGPFGTVLSAGEYVDGGVPLVNPTHIVRGAIVPESHVSVPESVAKRISHHRLNVGDIVMGRKGDVGRSAMISPREDGWLCGSDSIAIRCLSTSLDPEYLALALSTSMYRQQLSRSSTGATITNVNESILLNLRLPRRTLTEQSAAVAAGRRMKMKRDQLVSKLALQCELLVEHRKALIAAAVIGQLDMPEVINGNH
jgi:type I restriction enzyme S subunit